MWNIRVSAVILHKGKILMVNHKKQDMSYWLLPGGGIEVGESCEIAIKREMQEELMVDVIVGDIAFVVESIYESRHFLQVSFYCQLPHPDKIRLGNDPRIVGFGFISMLELNNIVVYPDIKSELVFFLRSGKFKKRYYYKKWVS